MIILIVSCVLTAISFVFVLYAWLGQDAFKTQFHASSSSLEITETLFPGDMFICTILLLILTAAAVFAIGAGSSAKLKAVVLLVLFPVMVIGSSASYYYFFSSYADMGAEYIACYAWVRSILMSVCGPLEMIAGMLYCFALGIYYQYASQTNYKKEDGYDLPEY
ncbi:MAG: hypothetical protein ACOX74_05710 [Lachnospiraceae bacterium]